MSAVFLRSLNLSITASWLILAVAVIRLLLKKAPKWISCVLWALVAIRLVCPFSFESTLSLIPSTETVPSNIAHVQQPAINSGISIINEAVNPVITESFTPGPAASANSLQIIIPILTAVWITGIAIMLAYALISYLRLKKKVSASIAVVDNIYACDEVMSPFILGIIKPVIYVPSSIDGQALNYVITHESAHIKRRDHWWKPFGYLLLAVYWFNPLCWMAYILLCRDIEMACDEKVIRDMDKDNKAAYSQALLDCSFPRRMITACPLAFGEVGVKERVKSVLSYKKPAFWIIIAAIAACVVAAVCFLTNPKKNEPDLSFLNYENAISTAASQTEMQTIYYPKTGSDENGSICIGWVKGNELAKYLDSVAWQKFSAPKDGLPSPGSIEFCIGDDYRITVYDKPRRARVTYMGDVRYYKIHGGDYEAAVKLFYTDITYRKNGDGTYTAENGITYKYLLTLTGLWPDAESGSWFKVLSNDAGITFDRVSESLFTSSTGRFLNEDEAIIAAMGTIGAASEKGTVNSKVSYANWTDDGTLFSGCLNRALMSQSAIQHLPIYKFDTKSELDQFKAAFSEILTMDCGYDEIPSFNDTTAGYDDAFFAEHSLMLAYVPANSGSYRFGLSGTYYSGTAFRMYVEQINAPEIHTDDMAGWFVTVEVKDSDIAICTEFDAQLGTSMN